MALRWPMRGDKRFGVWGGESVASVWRILFNTLVEEGGIKEKGSQRRVFTEPPRGFRFLAFELSYFQFVPLKSFPPWGGRKPNLWRELEILQRIHQVWLSEWRGGQVCSFFRER